MKQETLNSGLSVLALLLSIGGLVIGLRSNNVLGRANVTLGKTTVTLESTSKIVRNLEDRQARHAANLGAISRSVELLERGVFCGWVMRRLGGTDSESRMPMSYLTGVRHQALVAGFVRLNGSYSLTGKGNDLLGTALKKAVHDAVNLRGSAIDVAQCAPFILGLGVDTSLYHRHDEYRKSTADYGTSFEVMIGTVFVYVDECIRTPDPSASVDPIDCVKP